MTNSKLPFIGLIALLLIFTQCTSLKQSENLTVAQNNKPVLSIEAKDFTLHIANNMNVLLSSKKTLNTDLMNGYQTSDYLVINGNKTNDFEIQEITGQEVSDTRGKGKKWTITGIDANANITKVTTYEYFESTPYFIYTSSKFQNTSIKRQLLESLNTNHIAVKNNNDNPPYYAFQGSSTSHRSDWVRKIDNFYFDENFMGMNNSDYGGGIPVADIWRPDGGVAIGHIELEPKQVSFPTQLFSKEEDASVRMSVNYDFPTWIEPNETLESLHGFYSIHTGDYYETLQHFTQAMTKLGIEMVPSEESAYEPIWCAWGYERNFTKDEVIGTLDKVKELGIKWAVVDDGFQVAEGDWNLNKEKFPNGNSEMKEIVDAIHEKNLKAKVWWTPLAADPGSKVLQEHPKSIIYTEEWTPQFITWWDAYYLSPTNQTTKEHTIDVLKLFLEEWGFDGLKMDGQHMNAVPFDHNPEAGISDPSLAPEKLPEFFRLIYDQASSIKPNVVIENCPCGTCMSYYNMASMNQAVSSDPLSSWQIRHKGKTYKALVPHIAYYGDHVELSDNSNDFASSFGIGAVLGTKFTYPADNPTASESFLLTPEKEAVWKRWFSLYNEHLISKGNYKGELYDIGYDKPEAHCIESNGSLYYAFYDDNWNGQIEFRGIDPNTTYNIYDYYNDKIIGKLPSGTHTFDVSFTQNLLVQLIPN